MIEWNPTSKNAERMRMEKPDRHRVGSRRANSVEMVDDVTQEIVRH